jgi:F-type H+-transporting ATPase subunit b
MIAAVVSAAAVFAAEGELHADKTGLTTPNKWLPENYEIIWGGIASGVVFLLLWKYAIPALKKGLAARSERLGNELSSAAAAKAEAATSAATIRSNKGDLAGERSRLLAEADATAARVLDEGKARIAAEIADLEAKATADIAAGQVRAQGEVQTDVAAIASHALETVVTGSIDASTHNALIEDVIAKIGAGA